MATNKRKKAAKKKVVRNKAGERLLGKGARTRKQLGSLSRTSGHNFERKIVNMTKARFEDREWACELRRGDQSHRAVLPDVTGWPGLWPELQWAQVSTAEKKLEQAERDSAGKGVIPVAITATKGTKAITCTMRLGALARLLMMAARNAEPNSEFYAMTAQLPLETFYTLYDLSDLDLEADTVIRGEQDEQ